MNRKQLIFLLAVLAVIGGAGLVLLNQNKQSWTAREARMGDKVLPNFRFNEVAAIHIRGESELNVVQNEGQWRVKERNNYPANFPQISELLIKIKDLKVVQSEMVGPSQLPRVNLEKPGNGSGSGTLVEFRDAKGNVLDSLLLGKKHIRAQTDASTSPFGGVGSPDGCYILLRDDSKEVLLISDSLATLAPAPEVWVSKDFFTPEKIKSISLVSTNSAGSWKIFREGELLPWAMAGLQQNEKPETNRLSMPAGALSYPNFLDVEPSNLTNETGMDKAMIVGIETFDHFGYTLKIGPMDPDQSYRMSVAVTAEIPTVRIAGKNEKSDERKKLDQEFLERTKKLQARLAREHAFAGWVYKVNGWIEPLIRDRSEFLEEKIESTRPLSPAAVQSPFALPK